MAMHKNGSSAGETAIDKNVKKMEQDAEQWASDNPGTAMRVERAYQEGQEAVRRKPLYAPQNPYDEETEPEMSQAWEDGAYSAGLFGHNGIYTNGVLNKSER